MAKKKKAKKPNAVGGRLSKKTAKIVQKLIDGAHVRLRLHNAMSILMDRLKSDADKYFRKNSSVHKVFYGVSLKDPMNPVEVTIPATKRVTRIMVEKKNPGVALIWVTRSRVQGYEKQASVRDAVHTPRGQASRKGKKLGDDVAGALAI